MRGDRIEDPVLGFECVCGFVAVHGERFVPKLRDKNSGPEYSKEPRVPGKLGTRRRVERAAQASAIYDCTASTPTRRFHRL